jgi:hypothetical protein
VTVIDTPRPLAESAEWAQPGTVEPLRRLLPAHLEPLLRSMTELLRLEPGWDSYGGRPTNSYAAGRALALLVDAGWDGPLPSVSPMADGGITLEWGGDDCSVELIVRVGGNASVLIDVEGEMREAPVGGPGDPALLDALLWAGRLSAAV